MRKNTNIAFVILFLLLSGCRSKEADLSKAIKKGDAQKVKQLLGSGSNVNEPAYASHSIGEFLFMTRIREIGGAVSLHGNRHRERETTRPLHVAALWKRHEIMELLLDGGARVNAKTLVEEYTPLDLARIVEDTRLTEILLSHGARYSYYARQPEGAAMNTIHHAAYYGNLDILLEHLSLKTEVDVRNKDEWTALHTAAGAGNLAGAVILIDHGANPNVVNANGHVPLHLIAIGKQIIPLKSRNGYLGVARLLLDKGAEVNVRNNDGRTPLDLAFQKNDAELAALLSKYGGKCVSYNIVGRNVPITEDMDCLNISIGPDLMVYDPPPAFSDHAKPHRSATIDIRSGAEAITKNLSVAFLLKSEKKGKYYPANKLSYETYKLMISHCVLSKPVDLVTDIKRIEFGWAPISTGGDLPRENMGVVLSATISVWAPPDVEAGTRGVYLSFPGVLKARERLNCVSPTATPTITLSVTVKDN